MNLSFSPIGKCVAYLVWGSIVFTCALFGLGNVFDPLKNTIYRDIFSIENVLVLSGMDGRVGRYTGRVHFFLSKDI